jgi:hypothetical protein
MGGWEVEVTESRLPIIPHQQRPLSPSGKESRATNEFPLLHNIATLLDLSEIFSTLSRSNFKPGNSNRHHIGVKRLVFAYHGTIRTPQNFDTSLRINPTVLVAIQTLERS